jgi:hypothetical protein
VEIEASPVALMSQTRHRLTPAVQTVICRYILSGSYPQVAAEAAGIPREVFDRWMRRAQVRRPKKKYRLFYEAVMQASAQVRLSAEARALAKDPFAWLKCGPGKETADRPGWSNPPRAQDRRGQAVNLLLRRETQDLVTTLLRVLQPHPQVRAAVADALAALDAERVPSHGDAISSPDHSDTNPESAGN